MATTDLLSLEEARAAIGAPNQDYDTQLETMLSAVSQRFVTLVGDVVNTTYTEDYDPVGCTFTLRHGPLSSFTSVTEYVKGTASALTAETITTAGTYLWKQPEGLLIRRQSFMDYPWQGRVRVVYVAGRAASTAAVPERFKQACAITLAHLWRSEMGSGTQTFGAAEIGSFGPTFSIPNRALELIAADRLVPGIA